LAELPACSARAAHTVVGGLLSTLKRRAGSSKCSAALRSRHSASGAPSPVSTGSEQAPSQLALFTSVRRLRVSQAQFTNRTEGPPSVQETWFAPAVM